MQINSFYPVIMTADVAASKAFYTTHFPFEVTFEADWYVSLRNCLVCQLAGEHEGFLGARQTSLEARSSATGRESGGRAAEKHRAQPQMIVPDSF